MASKRASTAKPTSTSVQRWKHTMAQKMQIDKMERDRRDVELAAMNKKRDDARAMFEAADAARLENAALTRTDAQIALSNRSAYNQEATDAIDKWHRFRAPFKLPQIGHVCSSDGCSMEQIIVHPTTPVFGCRLTGTVHPCGEHCPTKVACADGFIHCACTGLQCPGRVMSHPFCKGANGDTFIGNEDVAKATVHIGNSQLTGRKISTREHPSIAKTKNTKMRIKMTLQQLLCSDNLDEIMEQRWIAISDLTERRYKAYENASMELGVMPNIHTSEDIVYDCRVDARLVDREMCDPKRLEYYVDLVFHMWGIVKRTYRTNRNDHHVLIFTLGCVYKFQHGFTVQKRVMVPRDEWLYHNLPPISDMSLFGFSKKAITFGNNELDEAVKKLVRSRGLRNEDFDVPRPERYRV